MTPVRPLTLSFEDSAGEARFRRAHNRDVLRQARFSLGLGVVVHLVLGLRGLWFAPAGHEGSWGLLLAVVGVLLGGLALTWLRPARGRLQLLMGSCALLAGVGPLLLLLLQGQLGADAYAFGALLFAVWLFTLSGLRYVVALWAYGALLLGSMVAHALALELPFCQTISLLLQLLIVGVLAGAAGYMMEQQWRRLFVQTEWLESERKSHAHRAMHDALTGLPNRHSLHQRLEEALHRARRNGHPLSLLFIDLDDFKPINDRHGHRLGDQVLVELAQRLRGAVREMDLVARLGGDEFVVLAEGTTTAGTAQGLAPKLLEVIQRGIAVSGTTGPRILRVTASIGIAGYPQHGQEARQLLQHADQAMYQAKAQGGGVAIYHAGNTPGEEHSVQIVNNE